MVANILMLNNKAQVTLRQEEEQDFIFLQSNLFFIFIYL